MNKPLAVVAVSGGMDSCVTAAIAAKDYQLCFAHFNYGQRTQQRELASFNLLAQHYSVTNKLIIDFTHFSAIGGSSLTDAAMAVAKADLASKEVPTSYVPFRNANILSVCVSWAEVLGAAAVFIGAVYEDASGYPDCRPEFYQAFQQMVRLGTKPNTHIEICTPIIHMSKAEIVRRGLELGAPLQHTWSCYSGNDVACGVCDSCAYRLRGFALAGANDPIAYALRPDYR